MSVGVGFAGEDGSGNVHTENTGNATGSTGSINSVQGSYSNLDQEQINRATIGEGVITIRDNPDQDISDLNRDIDIAQEIMRDESDGVEVYYTDSSWNSVTNPTETLENWQNSVSNYGSNAMDAVNNLERGADLGGLVVNAIVEYGSNGNIPEGMEKALQSSELKAAGWAYAENHPEYLDVLANAENYPPETVQAAEQAWSQQLLISFGVET
ncbi:hypothetical protein KIH87_12955 [Paraneptunicella aestuarii]|uniref:hypothetical protein n=1 Tax=Paraneptunicella aestuarii TaxID=2831148 RepID=UPI001E4B7F10|nr:hypothetical protein [Paraneptunicella aestuarii]UAA37619.1 hypothetical protein KIH87_12955 [Paraneptunicella aestuarii]